MPLNSLFGEVLSKFKLQLPVIAVTALSYYLFFELNRFIFSPFEYTQAVDWVFLPSGIRLLFILLFGYTGAVGIIISSIVLCHTHYFPGDLVTCLGAGLISGLSPLIAYHLCTRWLDLGNNLEKLNPAILLKLAAAFGIVSAALHQAWYSLRGVTELALGPLAVMSMGDFLGSLIILYLAHFALRFFSSQQSDRP